MNRIATLAIIFALVLILIISCGQKKTKEQLYAEALRYEREEQFEEAIKSFEQYVKNYPEAEASDSILFRIGQIYSNNLSNFEESVETHKLLINNYPESKLAAHSLFMIGYHFANNIRDFENARTYYNRFLETYPEHELANSVKWELDHLGKDINEIDFIQTDTAISN